MNHTEINFSIIIPYYNIIAGLKKLLMNISVYDDVQVIVVDDRSNKDLAEYARIKVTYEARGVLFLENNGVKGAGSCRNLGMKYAAGKWILFSDADDYFTDNFHQILLEYMDSSADLIYFSPTSVFMDTGKLAERHILYEQKIKTYLENPCHVNELHLKYDIASPWSKMFARKYLEANSIQFEEIMYSNDSSFSVKSAFYASSIEVSDKIIYCVTDRVGSLTKQTNNKAVQIRFYAFLRWAVFLKENLSVQDWKDLHVNGMGRLIDFFQQGANIGTLFGLMLKCSYKGIPFIDWSQISRKTFLKTFAILNQSRKINKYK